MKKLFLITILTISLITNAQEKTTKQFIYKVTFQPDSTDTSSILEERMYLFVNNHKSEFISYSRVLSDSLKDINDQSKLIDAMKIISKTRFKERIYKNKDSSSIITIDRLVSHYYEYKEPLNTFKWTIIDSTKVIAGYKCQKATTRFSGRDYIAWFTTEIPISDGPYKFNGLPGLIIAISDSNKHYNYTLIASSITALRKINIFKKNNIKVKKCKLLTMKKEMNDNIVQSMNTAGIKIGLTPEMKEEMNKAARKRNNPIELKCK